MSAEDSLTLNDVRFTNRARCALDSEKPSDSAFVLLSNMDIARAIYRVAKNRNENSTELTKKGIQVYRQTVLGLLQLIHKKLINRELPLLVADTTSDKIHVPDNYRSVMEVCSSDDYCAELDEYIEKIWTISSDGRPLAARQNDIFKLDNYHSKQNFIQNDVFENEERQFNYRCHYLRKFSPLEAQLFGTRPDVGVFESLARATMNKEQYIARCDDFEKQENLKVASYEIKIPNLNLSKWNEQGFDYWNSLKIYFSWAFRNSPEIQKMGAPFANLFNALAVEDALLIVPNSCKSITPPKCEAEYLNQNVIREFAKSSYKKTAMNLDILDSVPDGAQADLLSDPFTTVNTDILGLANFQSSDAWLDNFRDNFSGTRAIVKRKLLRAINHLDVVTKNVNVSKLAIKLKEKFVYSMNSSMDPKVRNDLKNELFYVCSEYTFATNEELSFIKKKLNLLKELTLLDNVTGKIVDSKSSEFFLYFEKLSKEVNALCGSVNQNKIWDNNFSLDKSGFSSWYLDKVYDNKIQSTENDRLKAYLATNTPILSYTSYKTSKSIDDVLCANEVDCTRKTLKSIVDIYGALQYADTFFTLDQKLKSPDLFNPYAERTACRVYDPWFKTKQTMFRFFTDIAQGALATVAPGVIFAKFDLKPGKVVSFNQLVKDGKISYDTKYNKTKVQAGLTADFGNLLGVPCAVTISGGEINPYDVVQFSGISARACTESEKNVVNVDSASDIGANEQNKKSACVVCALNFDTVSKSAATLSQAAGPQFFIIRALVGLYKGFSDSLNIPRSWEANPEYVLASFKRFGKITNSCVRSLGNGNACMANACENSILEAVLKKVNGSYVSSNTAESYRGKSTVRVSSCGEPISIKLSRVVTSSTNTMPEEENCSVNEVIVPKACQSILK